MSGVIGIVGGGEQLEQLLGTIGMRGVSLPADHVGAAGRGPVQIVDAILVDLRQDRSALALVSSLKRQYASAPVVAVASALEPELMLEAMRAGVNEIVPEPLTGQALETALGRVVLPRSSAARGLMVAIVGAKGGVGATTVAVNLAEALARALHGALLVDLNVGAGDAAVFLGIEPRFTVIEALENTQRLDATFLKSLVVRTRSGLELLGASSRVMQGAIDPQRVRTLLDFLTTYSNAVVLDIPRTDWGLLESLDTTTAIFVVVNQELPTLRNAHPLLKRLKQRYGDRVAILVNRSDKQSEISHDDVARVIGVPIRHVFPNDYRQATSAANRGQPMASAAQGQLPEAFHALARDLAGLDKAPAARPDEPGGILRWLPLRSKGLG